MDDAVPECIGKYLIGELLGEGAFGHVYRAEDTALGRSVAIKILKRTATSRTGSRPLTPEEWSARVTDFRQEASILAKLEHPNIVPVYDLDKLEDGRWYIVSKFIDGTSLSRRMQQRRLSPVQSAEIVATVARALHHAHTHRLIHRDVKPANILLDSTDHPYVVDFGLALSDEDYGSDSALQGGTPLYMSPEQASCEGHLVDSRSDVFSLGVVLYELLTGERPFHGSTRQEVFERIKTLDPRPPRMLARDIPKELERICLKSLSKRRSERYSTALDMADDLCLASVKPSAFLSCGRSDRQTVDHIARRLRAEGVDVHLDQSFLSPGDPWDGSIEDAMDTCGACVVCFGSAQAGSWQHEHARQVIERRLAESSSFSVIPVLLPEMQRPDRSQLPWFLVTTAWVEFRTSCDDDDSVHRLLSLIRGVEPDAVSMASLDATVCPYRGLDVFEPQHEHLFFGREALTEWLLESLRCPGMSRPENRFLAIVGASGSGKSSLARAGLVPALRRGLIEGSATWPTVICRPGNDPLESIAVALSAEPSLRASEKLPPVDELLEKLEKHKETLHLTTRVALHGGSDSQRVVLLVDQFEEIFTQCHDEGHRRAAIDNLLYAANIPGGRTIVVLTMRADFYEKCAGYPELAAAVSRHQELVGPLMPHDLRRAIKKPAQLLGCDLEPGLVELVTQAIDRQPGALPLLQYTMAQLWERREGHRLTLAAYHELGGLEAALEKRANQVWASLADEQQETCRRLFLRLTQPGEGTEDTKRRVARNELDASEATDVVVERLVQARLITVMLDQNGSPRGSIEIAHEALIAQWSRLRGWLDADRESLRTHHRLIEAAHEWQHKNKDASFLYRGERLRQTEQWTRAHELELATVERDFLQSSRAEEDRAERQEQSLVHDLEVERDRRQVERQIAARRFRRLAALATLLALLAVGASVLGIRWARIREIDAARQRVENLINRSKEAVLAGFPQHAILLAVEATNTWQRIRIPPIASAEECLRDALRNIAGRPLYGHTQGVAAVAITADSVVTAGFDNTVRRWDQQTLHPLVITDSLAPFHTVAITPDGRWLAASNLDGNVELRDLSNLDAEVLRWDAHEGQPVSAIAISPNGCWMATGGGGTNPKARVWDLCSPSPNVPVRELSGHLFPIAAIAISPDGRWVVTGGVDNTARRWDMDAPDPTAESLLLQGHHTDDVVAVAISPDGRWIVTGSKDQTAGLWDAMAGPAIQPVPLEGHTGAVTAVALSFDGRYAATAGSQDHTVRFWEREDLQRGPRVFVGHDGAVLSLAFDPNSLQLVSGSSDGTARLWDLQAPNRFAHPTILAKSSRDADVEADILSAAIDGQGHSSVVGFWRDAVHLWDLPVDQDSCESASLKDKAGRVKSIAITPDQRWLAMGGMDGTIHVWDLDAAIAKPLLFNDAQAVVSLALSPDGRWLASAGDTTVAGDTTIQIRDLQGDPTEEPKVFGVRRGSVLSVAITPGGRWLVAGGSDGIARVWDSQNPGRTPIDFPGHGCPVSAVAISPDGQWLVTGTFADSLVRIWRASKGSVEPVVLTGHTDSVLAAAIDPNGRWFMTASVDGTARFWRLTLDELLNHARLVVGREFTEAEWNQEFPGEPWREVLGRTRLSASPANRTAE